MTVQRVLEVRDTHAPIVAPDARISTVIAALEAEEVGALEVSTDGLHVVGIITEGDVVRGLLNLGRKVLDQKVHEPKSLDVFTCNANDRVAGVMALMDARNIRHVPVSRALHLERSYGAFERSFSLPIDKIDAAFDSGILVVRLRKNPLFRRAANQVKIKSNLIKSRPFQWPVQTSGE